MTRPLVVVFRRLGLTSIALASVLIGVASAQERPPGQDFSNQILAEALACNEQLGTCSQKLGTCSRRITEWDHRTAGDALLELTRRSSDLTLAQAKQLRLLAAALEELLVVEAKLAESKPT